MSIRYQDNVRPVARSVLGTPDTFSEYKKELKRKAQKAQRLARRERRLRRKEMRSSQRLSEVNFDDQAQPS